MLTFARMQIEHLPKFHKIAIILEKLVFLGPNFQKLSQNLEKCYFGHPQVTCVSMFEKYASHSRIFRISVGHLRSVQSTTCSLFKVPLAL